MKTVSISEWHMKNLAQQLYTLLDACYSITPVHKNSGIRVTSQWNNFEARFYFQSSDRVVVVMTPAWNAANRQALISAIVRTFHWDFLPKGDTWCCGLFYTKPSTRLIFAL